MWCHVLFLCCVWYKKFDKFLIAWIAIGNMFTSLFSSFWCLCLTKEQALISHFTGAQIVNINRGDGKLGVSSTKRNKFYPSSSREFSCAFSSFRQLFLVTHVGTRGLFLATSLLVASAFDRRCVDPTTNHLSRLTQGKYLWYPEYIHRPSLLDFYSTTTTIKFLLFPRTTTFFCNYKPVAPVIAVQHWRRGRWRQPVLMRYLWRHRRNCIRVQIYEIPESNRLAAYYCHWKWIWISVSMTHSYSTSH